MGKLYKIEFMAELNEDDVNAMQSCFYQAMNEAMNIYGCCGLKLTPVDDSEPENLEEVLKKPFEHINDVKKAFELCKSRTDVQKVIDHCPQMLGMFDITEFNDEEGFFTVLNTFYDGQTEDMAEEEIYLEYPEDWIYDEEDEEIDRLYHDCSEEELRKMGCFGDEEEEDE